MATTSPCLREHMRASQRGTALFESLVAFVVLAVASLTAAQVQSQLRLHGDLARQRSEAVRLGERELETLRAWSTLEAASGASAYAAIVDAETLVDAATNPVNNADYRIVRRIDDAAFAGAKSATVAVEWVDRGGAAQQLVIESFIARSDPVWSGALAVGTGAGVPRGNLGRSPAVPVTARSLGDGRSALKLASSGSAAVVFDDRSGDIVSRCDGISASTATRDLTASDLSACSEGRWRLLSGSIRFTSAVPPLAADAHDTPPPVAVVLALSGAGYPAPADCSTEAMKTVRYAAAGSVHLEAVPIDALPASLGLATWQDTGDRYVAYRCIVAPRADGRWSGRSTLVPSGWTIGAGHDDRRVCRYASDLDGSGAIDANIEHPADYAEVAGSLQAQNFLIVRGDQACPAATAGDLLTAGFGTVQHQP
jgi:Tfp pilus assembly protein PilV